MAGGDCKCFALHSREGLGGNVWQAKVDKNGVFSNITNSFSNITNSFSNITNSFSDITNSFSDITN